MKILKAMKTRAKYFHMMAVCQKCGELKDIGVDHSASETYENSALIEYPKPKKFMDMMKVI